MFLKLSIPDKPTYYPIVPPDETLVKLCEENPIDIENLLKSSL